MGKKYQQIIDSGVYEILKMDKAGKYVSILTTLFLSLILFHQYLPEMEWNMLKSMHRAT